MWSYYGRKTKVVKYYPEPIHSTIIEPFAGTAVYSLYGDNWKKKVILRDKYEKLIAIWHYLQKASEHEILGLPDMVAGDKTTNLNVCQEAKWLIGFCINRGSANPKITAKKFNSWNTDKVRIAKNLHRVRHWDIAIGDYRNIENQEATWFIDPPYQVGNIYYKHKTVNYEHLSEWCRERLGQVIVCENSKADWMDFKPLKQMQGQKHVTTESYWTN